MKHKWNVKYNGKLDILIFSYLVILLAYLVFTLRVTSKDGSDFFEEVWTGLLLFFPFVLAAIIAPISTFKKVIPKSIEIDLDKNAVEFVFFKKIDSIQIDFEDLSYQKIEKIFFTILVFYQKKIATRGHTLHVELFSIIAPDVSTSWKKKQANEIFDKLKESNIEEHLPLKSKPIIDYLLS